MENDGSLTVGLYLRMQQLGSVGISQEINVVDHLISIFKALGHLNN